MEFGHYGEERDLVCTEEERQIYDNICRFFDENELDKSPLRFVRVSDSYVTAKYADWDLVRMKYTTRAKWLVFPVADLRAEKHRVTSPDELFDYGEAILYSVEHIRKYL